MKKYFIILGITLFTLGAYAQPAKYDSVSVLILDRMSDFIGELQSCKFNLHVSNDVLNAEKGFIKQYTNEEVFMVGPDKMLVNTNGPKGHRSYFYNGTELAYYSHTENNYGIIEVPPTIMGVIETVNEEYGIEFPAADFFYPAFTDDLISSCESISYIGKATLNGKECFHILAKSKDADMQFWIGNDAYNLPAKMVIVYKNQNNNPQYEATFGEWEINPVVPDAMFNFLPPPGASRVRIISKAGN